MDNSVTRSKASLSDEIAPIVESLPDLERQAHALREILLANLVMVGEIPAPTSAEERRIAFLLQRFSECGLNNVSSDELGNGLGIIPGTDGEDNILVVAHADTVFSEKINHTVNVETDRVVGPGVANNSLGVAVLATLPTLLEQLQVKLKSNLILMGVSQSLGRGNLKGLRFFLRNNTLPICAGLCVEGVQLGRLSHAAIGMVRGEISCNVSEEFEWTKFGATSAILVLNDVINKIEEIPLPKRPPTTVVIGSIEGGTTYNTIASHAAMKLEIRSESAGRVKQIRERIDDIVAEVATKTGADVSFDAFASRRQGGIEFNHPLVKIARSMIKGIGIEPRVSPSISELAALIYAKVPAVTIGITTGEQLNEPQEWAAIAPMFKGLAQLVGILQAVDVGCSHEN
jgi:di/tripeptidase